MGRFSTKDRGSQASQIFALGGLPSGDEVDRKVVEASGHNRPLALCIPTAVRDSIDACKEFSSRYGETLHCRVDYLRVFNGEKDGDDFARKIRRADIIYVPDGDLSLLVHTLREYRIDEELQAAFERGVVMCGVGAGAICWGTTILDERSSVGLGLVDTALGLAEAISIDRVRTVVNTTAVTGILIGQRATVILGATHFSTYSELEPQSFYLRPGNTAARPLSLKGNPIPYTVAG